MQLLTPALGLLIWTLVAFLIVFFILKKYAWPAIINGLKTREQSIADSIATAEKIKSEMSQMKSEHENLLAQAREERATLVKEARQTADKMIADAKEKAKAEYDKIVADAQQTITQQKNAALIDVKNYIGKMVIEVSEKVIRRELSNTTEHETYISKLSDDLKQLNN